jgi:hypothetical protein
VFNAPAKALDLRGNIDGVYWKLRGEGVELEPIKGQQFVVHGNTSSELGR